MKSNIEHRTSNIKHSVNDLRLAFRSLTKSPGFTVVAVITVALAIAANTAVFSPVNALLIRPLPFQAPQNLVLLLENLPRKAWTRSPSRHRNISIKKTRRAATNASRPSILATFNLTGGDMPERIQGAVVTPSLFPLLGIAPIKGRVFNPDRISKDEDDVVMISARLWRRRFNSDPQLVGTQVPINGRSFHGRRDHAGKVRIPAAALPRIGRNVCRARRHLEADRFHQTRSWNSRGFSQHWATSTGRRRSRRHRRKRNHSIANSALALSDNYEPATKFGAHALPMHNLVIGGMRAALMILVRRGRRGPPDRLREPDHHVAGAGRSAGTRVRDSSRAWRW